MLLSDLPWISMGVVVSVLYTLDMVVSRRGRKGDANDATPSFFLDHLQKDAQASEMDHTNTTPGFFVFLSLLQVAVTQLLALYCGGTHWQMVAALCVGSHWLGFAISVALDSNFLYDITEDISYFLIIAYNYAEIAAPSDRVKLLHGCALLWCLRLLCFVGYRILVRGSDWRFDKLVKAKAYNFFGWTSGGTWCFMNGFCLWSVTDSVSCRTPLTWLDGLGLSIFVLGLSLELTADIQKYMFNAGHASGTNKSFIDKGLWGWSRHPNYCGEISLWFGLAIVSIGGTSGLTLSSAAFAMVTPAWSMFFLIFTSLMLLEKRADAKWGGEALYERYKKRVPVLFPGM